jgi:hypothetical protein
MLLFLLKAVLCNFNRQKIISLGKAISLQAWTGAYGSRRLRLPDL